MESAKLNHLVYSYIQRVMTPDKKDAANKYFLDASCNLIHEGKVWPATTEQTCLELTAAYNYLVVNISNLICSHKQGLTCNDLSATGKVITTTFDRVYQCICKDRHAASSLMVSHALDDSLPQQMMKMVKALENPVLHFNSLNLLGRLLLFVGVGCLYRCQLRSQCQNELSFFIRLTEMAGDPVLKEDCTFCHGLLLASPVCEKNDVIKDYQTSVTVEDVICIFLATLHSPCHRLAITHQPWKWLFTSMECKNLIQVKSYTLAMQKLQPALMECQEPHHKSRLLCLVADCYFHMDCPQLSIQTYRDALHLDTSCFSILHQLSLVYRSMDLPDLELESLNLCVMAMAESQRQEKDKIPLIQVDEMLWSVSPPIPPVSFLTAKFTFARRCHQLKRYPEAAQQYSSLIRLLQQEDEFLDFEQHESNGWLDIAEVMVEAAEVLVLTQQYQDCIRLCDNTQPALSADDSLVRHSRGFDESPTDLLSIETSQSDFFQEFNESQNNKHSFNPFISPKTAVRSSVSDSHTSAHLQTSFEISRKRQRSKGRQEDDRGNEQFEDLKEVFLLTRLLLCKADALVLSTGFTDQAVNCLQQAIDILLRNPVPSVSKANQSFQEVSGVKSPVSKRQRISSDGQYSNCQSSHSQDIQMPETSTNEWSALLVNIALRLAKASLERKRFSSVLNCCRLMEQLDSDSLDALYLKTLILSENAIGKKEAIRVWLNKRGINPEMVGKKLEQTIAERQQILGQVKQPETKWWNISDKDFQEMDVRFLRFLAENQTK